MLSWLCLFFLPKDFATAFLFRPSGRCVGTSHLGSWPQAIFASTALTWEALGDPSGVWTVGNRVNTIPIKIPMTFFHRNRKTILKFVWNYKRPRIAKVILSNKKKTRGFIFPHFKLWYKAIITKTIWSWHKNRHIDQWNRKPRSKPMHIQSTSFWQTSIIYSGGKKSLFNKWCGKTGQLHAKKLNETHSIKKKTQNGLYS